MKRVFVLVLLLICSVVFAAEKMEVALSPAGWGGIAGSGTAAWSSGCPNAALLLCESFDGASLCTDAYSSNCDNPWVVSDATPLYNNTTPLDGGTYALKLPAQTDTGVVWVYREFTATDPIYLYFQFKITAISTAASYTYQIAYLSYGTGLRSSITIERSSGVNYMAIQSSGGTISSNTVGTIELNTTYHVWVSYAHGTGANAISTLGFSTTGIRPTSGDNYVTSTDGTATDHANRLNLKGLYITSSIGIDIVFDKIRVDDAQIGDNPT